jgi:tyrosine-protein kinase Etk/Wzc
MSHRDLLPTAAELTEPHAFGPLDVLVVLTERWKFLLAIPLAAGLVALAVTFAIRPTFTSTTRILVPQQKSSAAGVLVQQLGSLGGLASAAAGLKNPADQYVGLLASRTVADILIDRFRLVEVYDVELLDEARVALADRTSLSAGVKDGIIAIGVDDHDPKRAADLANAYVVELRKMLSEATLTEAGQRRLFFEGQLKVAQEKLIRSESALKASGLPVATLNIEPRTAFEEVATLRAAVTSAEIRLNASRGVLAESNPDLQQARRELQALRAQLSRAERGSDRGADPASEDYISRYRDFKYHEALFEMIAKQYELARLDEASDGLVVQVIDAAIPAERKSKPWRSLVAAGTSVMVFLALALWFVIGEMLRADPSTATAVKLHRLRSAFRRGDRG